MVDMNFSLVHAGFSDIIAACDSATRYGPIIQPPVKKKQNGNMQLSQSKVRQIQTLSDIKILS
jgi:hypothetical protein